MSATKPETEDGKSPLKLKTAEKRDQSAGMPLRLVRPKYLLPGLHDKTHFKAALEYSLGE